MLIDTIEAIEPTWLTNALHAGGALSADRTVTRARAELFGTGQFGLVARVELESDDPELPASMIAKLPSSDPTARQLGVGIGAYEGEVRFYQELAPRSSIAVPTSYFTAFEPGAGRVTLLLEDLSGEWTVGDAIAGGTLEQVEAAVDQIATLQADLWDTPDLKELDWLAAPARTQMLFDHVPAAMPAFRERFGPRIDPAQMKVVERLAPLGDQYPATAWQGPMVVCHGDLRLDNLLFRDGRCTVIDWQSLRLGPPGVDLAVLLGTALSVDDRQTHLEALVERWHDRLSAGGVRDFAVEDCWASLRAGSLYLFLLSVGMSVNLQQSERGDALFAGMVGQGADFIAELGADTYLKEIA